MKKKRGQFGDGRGHDVVLWHVRGIERALYVADCRASRTYFVAVGVAPEIPLDDLRKVYVGLLHDHLARCEDKRPLRHEAVLAYGRERAWLEEAGYEGTDGERLTARDIVLSERGARA